MTGEWHKLHITDKSGQIFFNCTASPKAVFSTLRNYQWYIADAKRYPEHFTFLDAETAFIVLDGERYGERYDEPTLDELYSELIDAAKQCI